MRIKTVFTTLLATLMLVIGVDYIALAASGQGFLLGRSNSASTTTTLSRTTNGPTLVLNSKAGQPPLKVNRAVKAPNLNADRVDGYEASTLTNRTYEFRTSVTAVTEVLMELPVPSGKYLATFNAYFSGGSGALGECFLYSQSNDLTNPAFFYAADDSVPGINSDDGDALVGEVALSGAGLVTKTSTNKVFLYCNSGAPFSTIGSEPLQATLTRINTASTAIVPNAMETNERAIAPPRARR